MPVLLGLPRQRPLYHSAPRMMMCGVATSVSTLLIVVGMPKTARGGRERRLDARVAAAALDGVHQGGFFAADVGTGTPEQHQVDPFAAAESVGARARPCRTPP